MMVDSEGQETIRERRPLVEQFPFDLCAEAGGRYEGKVVVPGFSTHIRVLQAKMKPVDGMDVQ